MKVEAPNGVPGVVNGVPGDEIEPELHPASEIPRIQKVENAVIIVVARRRFGLKSIHNGSNVKANRDLELCDRSGAVVCTLRVADTGWPARVTVTGSHVVRAGNCEQVRVAKPERPAAGVMENV